MDCAPTRIISLGVLDDQTKQTVIVLEGYPVFVVTDEHPRVPSPLQRALGENADIHRGFIDWNAFVIIISDDEL